MNQPSLTPQTSRCRQDGARFADSDCISGAPTQPTLLQNRVLGTLPPSELERLRPDLESVALPIGRIIQHAGDRPDHLYFVTRGIVCRFCEAEDGAFTELAMIGRDGMIGVESFLSGVSMPSNAVVLSAGHAYRLKLGRLQYEFFRGGPLQHALLHYTQVLITQIAQTAACNRHHTLEQQLCRWLLHCHDCLTSDELLMTQDAIANLLGVRREGITDAAGRLHRAGLIEHRRGRIKIVDRAGLEARGCECYAVVKKELDRLLPQGIHSAIPPAPRVRIENAECSVEPSVAGNSFWCASAHTLR